MDTGLTRNDLITENYYLIHYVIKHLIDTSIVKDNPLLDYDDLVQQGAVGLCNAADHYDEKKGAFSTLACTAIKNALLSALSSTSATSSDLTLNEETDYLFREEEYAGLLLSSIFQRMEKGGEKNLELKKALAVLLYEGYSLRQSAKLLGITHQKARVCLDHIRKYAKKELVS